MVCFFFPFFLSIYLISYFRFSWDLAIFSLRLFIHYTDWFWAGFFVFIMVSCYIPLLIGFLGLVGPVLSWFFSLLFPGSLGGWFYTSFCFFSLSRTGLWLVWGGFRSPVFFFFLFSLWYNFCLHRFFISPTFYSSLTWHCVISSLSISFLFSSSAWPCAGR